MLATKIQASLLVSGTPNSGKAPAHSPAQSGYMPESTARHFLPGFFVSMILTLPLLAHAFGPTDGGYWSTTSGGSWANTADWDSGVIADGTDNNAYFGFSLEAAVPASATFTLDGARTIGNLYFIPQNTPANWILTAGSGGALTLDTTFNPPEINVNLPSVEVTIGAVLAGTKGLIKDGEGTLILTAANTYSGDTTVRAGRLLVNGAIGASRVLVEGGSLNGTGTIGGPMEVQPGGTLSLGGAIGSLSINNSLTLDAGSTTLIKVNAATLGHDIVQGLTDVNYAGSLVIQNLGGMPAAGQSFHIFGAVAASGNFSSISPSPGPGLAWRFDPGSGVLSVVPAGPKPMIANIAMQGANVVLQVANGVAGTTGYVLYSTNMSSPVANWTRLATNIFDVNGGFSFTTSADPASPARFYLISVPQGL